MANTTLIYPVDKHSSEELIQHVLTFLADGQDMDTQRLDHSDNFSVVQARVKGASFKKVLGLDRAVTVYFIKATDSVSVSVGEAKWLDKGIVMTISMFILWPLTVTSGVGIYKQKKLISNLVEDMNSFMVDAPAYKSYDFSDFSKDAGLKISHKIDQITNSSAMQHIIGEAPKILRMFKLM